jgi:phage-related minor tail protein
MPDQTPDHAADLADLASAGAAAADAIDQAFAKAGDSLGRSLAKGAADGKLSLADLARAALSAVDQLAGVGSSSPTAAVGGLGAALGQALGSAIGGAFSGARADGGPVSGGGAYLVGERGPEVFRPSTGGEIGPAGSGGVSVTLNVQGGADPAAFARSDAQIAQALARAVRMGLR